MSRKVARDLTFKLVFEYEFSKQKNPLTLEDFLVLDKVDEKDENFVKDTYEGIIENYNSIIEVIKENLKGYTLERLYKIDLAILVLAVYEMLYTKEVSAGIVINEAVELSKKYSTEKSFSFINGVLSSINKKEESNE